MTDGPRRKTHRNKRKAYERRRRTRRQRGGNGGEALTRWLLAANAKREAGNYTPPWEFSVLRDANGDLRLTAGPAGPILSRFEPSSLGDIITNIAATFEGRIPNGQTFIAVMTKLKAEDPDVYRLLQRLETVLREEAQRRITSTLVATAETDLTAAPTDNRPPFLWIAYANLDNLDDIQPVRPVLLKELPPAPVSTSAPVPAPMPAPVEPFQRVE